MTARCEFADVAAVFPADEPDWTRALCRFLVHEGVAAPADWFPTSYHDTRKPECVAALAACGRCPIKGDCLAYALRLPLAFDCGIRGGLGQKDRHLLRKGSK